MAWPRRNAPSSTFVGDAMLGPPPGGSRGVRHATPWRWSLAAGLLGLLLAVIAFAPASWLARALASASGDRLLITDTRGSVWNGSGVLVLTGGEGSRDASALPGRVRWSMLPKLQDWGLVLQLGAQQDCCINGTLLVGIRPGLGRLQLSVDTRADWLARLPASVLAGLGTPLNTLQPIGTLRLSARELQLEWVEGRWRQLGELQLDLINVSSRVSPVAPLGSYRLQLTGDPGNPGVSTVRLQTLEGALQLTGTGTLNSAGTTRFVLEAGAAPGRQEALDNLLNIIGRRQGARSVFTIG
ncbi:type II secretion system protein N [Roseateles sp.]